MVIWLSVKEGTPPRGYWDQRLLEELFIDQDHVETNSIPDVSDAIVVIPAAYQAPFIDKINTQLQKLKSVTVVITSDEENNFPIDELSHPDMRVFANYYNPKYESNIHWLPIGPANTFKIKEPREKDKAFVFAGQGTPQARADYIKELKKRSDGLLLVSGGFAQGLAPREYFDLLTSAKVVASPMGAVSPDAFRTYEAIVAGAVPVATDPEWHQAVFADCPFPVIQEFKQVNGYIDDAIAQYPKLNNEVQAWWIKYKRNLKSVLLRDKNLPITIMIPCSPIKSHPSISVIDETIKTIRHHLPEAEIIVTFDGVREEQQDRRADYEEFKRRFLFECFNNSTYQNVLPLIFKEHMHQVKLAREALGYVKTDKVLYIEQDTPLTPDEPIDWQKCYKLIDKGFANVVRFHFEAQIPEPHKHLMIGDVENSFLKTFQWSQRPHIISVAYFERILTNYFTTEAICFIEDKMHGVVQEDVNKHGTAGWNQHRIYIYHPEGNIKRSYHLDGRAGGKKWDGAQTW